MRKITCAKCGHEDHVQAVQFRPTNEAERALPMHEARELGLAIAAGDLPRARIALEQLVADFPTLRHEVETGLYSAAARAA